MPSLPHTTKTEPDRPQRLQVQAQAQHLQHSSAIHPAVECFGLEARPLTYSQPKKRNKRRMAGLLHTDGIEQGLEASLALSEYIGTEIPCW